MNPWQRLLNMILDGLQTLFATVWGLTIAAVSGAIPAAAGAAAAQVKYGDTYWRDMIPVALAGALMGAAGFLTHRSQVQRALSTSGSQPAHTPHAHPRMRLSRSTSTT